MVIKQAVANILIVIAGENGETADISRLACKLMQSCSAKSYKGYAATR